MESGNAKYGSGSLTNFLTEDDQAKQLRLGKESRARRRRRFAIVTALAAGLGLLAHEFVWWRVEDRNSEDGYRSFASYLPFSPRAKVASRRADDLKWPPGPRAAMGRKPSGKVSMRTGGSGEGWDYVLDVTGEHIKGWGPLVSDGEIELPYSLFEVKDPPSSLAKNYFEVVYYDDARTFIRLDKKKGHRLLIGTENAGNARVEYAGREYLLKKDGWYVVSDAWGGDAALVQPLGPRSSP